MQQSDNFRKQFHLARHPLGSHARKPMRRAGLLLPQSGSYQKLCVNLWVVIWKMKQYAMEVRFSPSVYLTICSKWPHTCILQSCVHRTIHFIVGLLVLQDTDEKNHNNSWCATLQCITKHSVFYVLTVCKPTLWVVIVLISHTCPWEAFWLAASQLLLHLQRFISINDCWLILPRLMLRASEI